MCKVEKRTEATADKAAVYWLCCQDIGCGYLVSGEFVHQCSLDAEAVNICDDAIRDRNEAQRQRNEAYAAWTFEADRSHKLEARNKVLRKENSDLHTTTRLVLFTIGGFVGGVTVGGAGALILPVLR